MFADGRLPGSVKTRSSRRDADRRGVVARRLLPPLLVPCPRRAGGRAAAPAGVLRIVRAGCRKVQAALEAVRRFVYAGAWPRSGCFASGLVRQGASALWLLRWHRCWLRGPLALSPRTRRAGLAAYGGVTAPRSGLSTVAGRRPDRWDRQGAGLPLAGREPWLRAPARLSVQRPPADVAAAEERRARRCASTMA